MEEGQTAFWPRKHFITRVAVGTLDKGLVDHEMRMQWEAVHKDEELFTKRILQWKRSERGKQQVEKERFAPETGVAQTQMKNMEAGHEKKRKTTGWSTMMLEEVACKLESEDTEEMLQ